MFIEVNEMASYATDKHDSKGYVISGHYIKGKILINTDFIRSISISSYRLKDEVNHIVDEDSIVYTVYFDKDRSETIDIESYNKIKNYLIKKEDNTIFE